MLSYLRLENFKKHKELEVEFKPGLNLIVGPNWAGKTTILHGILFALGGPSAVPGGNKIIKPRAGKGRVKVELGFWLQDNPYVVTRGGTTVRLTRDGDLIASGAAPVTAELESLFGMSMRTFGDLRVSKQGETEAMLTLGAGRLSDIVNEITRGHLIDEVRTALGKRENQLSGSDLEDLSQSLSETEQNVELLLQKVSDVHQQQNQAQAGLAAASETEQQAQAFYQKKRRLLDAWHEHQRKEAARTNQLGQLQATLQARQEELGRCPAAVDVQTKRQEHQALQEAVRAALDEHQRAVQKFAKQQQDEEEDLKVIGRLVEMANRLSEPVCDEELDQLIDEHTAAQESVFSCETKIRQLIQELESSTCHACGRPFEGGEEHAVETQAKIDGLQVELPKLKAAADQAANACQEARRKQEAQDQALSILRAVQDSAEDTSALSQEQVAALHGKYQVLARRDVQIGAELRQADATNKTRRDLEQAVADTQQQIAQLRAQVTEAQESVSQAEVDAAAATWEEARQSVGSAQTKSQELASAYSAAYYAWKSEDDSLQRLRQHEEKRKQVGQDLVQVRKLGTYLANQHKAFLDKTWGAIMTYAGQFSAQATAGAVSAVQRPADGGFTYTEDGVEAPVAAASGVQKAVIGLGVRLALAEALRTPLDFVLLDEVTAAASDENSLALAATLAQTSEQTIMVTHRQSDAAVADHVISL